MRDYSLILSADDGRGGRHRMKILHPVYSALDAMVTHTFSFLQHRQSLAVNPTRTASLPKMPWSKQKPAKARENSFLNRQAALPNWHSFPCKRTQGNYFMIYKPIMSDTSRNFFHLPAHVTHFGQSWRYIQTIKLNHFEIMSAFKCFQANFGQLPSEGDTSWWK